MRKPVAMFVALIAVCCLCGVVLAAGPRGVPHRYVPRSLDEDLQTIVRTTDGTSFAAWSYRNGAEYDIAISRSDDSGRWTEPEFFGADDGLDQVQPALALDRTGNLYVAYADRADGGIRLIVLSAAGESWSQPLGVRDRGRVASQPALRVVQDRLALAFESDGKIEMIDLPLDPVTGSISALTITESGDPVGYRPGDEGSNPGGGGTVPTIAGESRPVEIFLPVRRRGPTSGGEPY